MKNTKPIDKSEKLALENELRTDKFGAKVERIEMGPSGKPLNLEDFKFDQNFGGKFHQQPVYEDRRDAFGTDDLARVGTAPLQPGFSSEQASYFDSSSKQQSADPTPPGQASKIGEKGFLDFENIFAAPGKGYNPFN